jgi:hypothetical protein
MMLGGETFVSGAVDGEKMRTCCLVKSGYPCFLFERVPVVCGFR